MAIDVTDATFQTEVVDRSNATAVVVDLWAPWCGPCRTIGPILEKVTDATNGDVILAKVNSAGRSGSNGRHPSFPLANDSILKIPFASVPKQIKTSHGRDHE